MGLQGGRAIPLASVQALRASDLTCSSFCSYAVSAMYLQQSPTILTKKALASSSDGLLRTLLLISSMMLSQSLQRLCSIFFLYQARESANFEYFGFYSIAEIVLQAVLFELIKFLKATLNKFLSSEDTPEPLASKTGFKKSTISSKRSAYSATLAKKILSSTDILLNYQTI